MKAFCQTLDWTPRLGFVSHVKLIVVLVLNIVDESYFRFSVSFVRKPREASEEENSGDPFSMFAWF